MFASTQKHVRGKRILHGGKPRALRKPPARARDETTARAERANDDEEGACGFRDRQFVIAVSLEDLPGCADAESDTDRTVVRRRHDVVILILCRDRDHAAEEWQRRIWFVDKKFVVAGLPNQRHRLLVRPVRFLRPPLAGRVANTPDVLVEARDGPRILHPPSEVREWVVDRACLLYELVRH